MIYLTSTTTARKAQVAGGSAFLAPLFITIPCSETALTCHEGAAAGLLIAQAGLAAVGLGEAPDGAMLGSALNAIWVSIGAAAVTFVVTWLTTNKPKV